MARTGKRLDGTIYQSTKPAFCSGSLKKQQPLIICFCSFFKKITIYFEDKNTLFSPTARFHFRLFLRRKSGFFNPPPWQQLSSPGPPPCQSVPPRPSPPAAEDIWQARIPLLSRAKTLWSLLLLFLTHKRRSLKEA